MHDTNAVASAGEERQFQERCKGLQGDELRAAEQSFGLQRRKWAVEYRQLCGWVTLPPSPSAVPEQPP